MMQTQVTDSGQGTRLGGACLAERSLQAFAAGLVPLALFAAGTAIAAVV